MLPESQHCPPGGSKCVIGVSVSALIGLNLLAPPPGIRLRPSPVLWTAMPKAAVNKNDNLSLDKGDVGSAPRIWQTHVNTVSKTQFSKLET